MLLWPTVNQREGTVNQRVGQIITEYLAVLVESRIKCETRGSATGGGGSKEGKSPPKDFKKGEIKKDMGNFHASKLLKLAFLSSLSRKYVLWKGFYHDSITKKASASGGAPWTPEVPSPPLTIYPGGAAPV